MNIPLCSPVGDHQYRILIVGVGKSGGHIIEHLQNRISSTMTLLMIDEETDDQIVQKIMQKSDLTIITLGLGGKVGSTLTPRLAGMAKDAGAFVLGVVTKPFRFEGKHRLETATKALNELNDTMDAIVLIPNDSILPLIDPTKGIKESFQTLDSFITQTIQAITGTILASDNNDISIDINDLRSIMAGHGTCFSGWGESKGHNAASEAITNAIATLGSDKTAIKNASGIIVHFTMNPEFHYMQLAESIDIIHRSVNEWTTVIFATTTDRHHPHDYIRVTLIVAGLDKKILTPVNNVW